jgi:hypothetical protein
MGSAQATTGEPPKGPSLDQQVGQMLKEATPQPAGAGAGENAPGAGGVGGGAGGGSSLDEQVGAALAQAKTGEQLDEQLAAAAAKAIDDEFADPATLEDALPSVAPKPETVEPTPAESAAKAPATPVVAAVVEEVKKPEPPASVPVAPAAVAAVKPAPAPEAEKKPASAAPAAAAAKSEPAPAGVVAADATPKVAVSKRIKDAAYAGFVAFSGIFEPLAIKLGAMSTQARHTIAWAALVTLFNAAVVWGVVLLKSPPGYGPPKGEQPMLVGPDGKPTIEPPKHAEPVEEKHASEGAKDEGHDKPSGGGGGGDSHGGGH